MGVLNEVGLEVHRLDVALLAVRKDAAEAMWDEFEKALTRSLARTWTKTAKRAANAVSWDGTSRTKATAKRIAGAVARVVDGWLDDDTTVESTVPMLYEALVTQFLRDYDVVAKARARRLIIHAIDKATRKGDGARFTAELSKRDKQAIEAITKLTEQAAGKLFPDDVAAKVATVVEDVVLNEGLTPDVAATRLQAEVRAALGLGADAVVPTRFATNPEGYFRLLANNASLLSTNMGRVIAMDDAGVEAYEVVAVLDSKTSQICRAMHGRVIPVRAGVGMVEAVIEAAGPTELAAKFPWGRHRAAQDLGPDTPANNAKLAGTGLGFPPYHGHCRSTVIPVV